MIATTTAPVYFDLGPSASYTRRRAGWFAGQGEHAGGRLGTLRIVLQKAKRSGDSTEVDEYGVQEEHDQRHPAGVRSFLLRNDTDVEQPDVYRCVVGSDAGGLVHDHCTCRAGAFGRACKHVAALGRFTTKGVL